MTLPIGTKIPLYAEGNATPSDVLEGKTFSTEKGNNLKGAIKNKGNLTLTPSLEEQNFSNGYYSNIVLKSIKATEKKQLDSFARDMNLSHFQTGIVSFPERPDASSYTLTHTINLGFKPKIVIAMKYKKYFSEYDSIEGYFYIDFGSNHRFEDSAIMHGSGRVYINVAVKDDKIEITNIDYLKRSGCVGDVRYFAYDY